MTTGFADPEQQTEAEKLARAILTRRRRKCIAQDAHTGGGECPRCGL